MTESKQDVIIVGAGPNGLTAAALLSAAGLSVMVLEGNSQIGGGCRTQTLTLPGFLHDVCAAIHPMGVVSPIFRAMRLEDYGLKWASAAVPLAHPLADGRVAVLTRQLADMDTVLGEDAAAWKDLVGPFVRSHESFFREILRPVRIPRQPCLMARFGFVGLRSCVQLQKRFRDAPARALLAGNAAHSFMPLSRAGSASFGLVLAIAGHALDWPCARGGSQEISEALARRARQSGCQIHVDVTVRSLKDLPPAKAILFNVTPRQLDSLAGGSLPPSYRLRLNRFVYGPGVFKIDYALSTAIPWRSSECATAATVHIGGSAEEIARSEAAANAGCVSEDPFVLVAQQSMMDETRAPAGKHTGWAYCHVPHGCNVDMTERIERQIERFAPGFRDIILARNVMRPADLEVHNPNMIGGDIGGGANTLSQFLFRPAFRWNPYATPNPMLFICSSSTPPGGGVHGMCGYWAAKTVLRRVFHRAPPVELEIA